MNQGAGRRIDGPAWRLVFHGVGKSYWLAPFSEFQSRGAEPANRLILCIPIFVHEWQTRSFPEGWMRGLAKRQRPRCSRAEYITANGYRKSGRSRTAPSGEDYRMP